MRVVTGEQMRSLDAAAIGELGIPGAILMEHAAAAVAGAVEELLPPGGRAVIVCGGGNNAGDGYAAARLLHLGGRDVRVLSVVAPEELAGDAALMAGIWRKLGGVLEAFGGKGSVVTRPGDVIVDALFGTGLSRAPEGRFLEAILAIHEARNAGAKVVAVDLPSGLSADTGRPFGAAVRADVTVTFAFLKRGLVVEPGASMAGDVRVAEISIPSAFAERLTPATWLLTEAHVRGLLPPRPADSHKGTFGHCLVVAGSVGRTGAAALAARSALVGGAGLVTVAARPDAVSQILAHAPEVMGLALPGDGPLATGDLEALVRAMEGKQAVVLGPGIPRGPDTGAMLGRLLTELDCPILIDADGLNALEGQENLIKGAASEVVVTPHPGEMARLVGFPLQEVQKDRIGVAERFAREYACTTVLKGARTVIADPGGDLAVNPTGNAGMATAGTGDVLAGLVGALLAQELTPLSAAKVGVYVHGLAGDLAAKARGRMGLTASDVIEGIAGIWAAWGA